MDDITQPITNLVINRLSRQKYHEMKNAGELKNDELYIITDDTLDAVGQPITNIGEPTADTDAATKKYVDSNAVSAFVFQGKTYYKSKIDLRKIYDLLFDIAKVLGATVIDDEAASD